MHAHQDVDCRLHAGLADYILQPFFAHFPGILNLDVNLGSRCQHEGLLETGYLTKSKLTCLYF